MILVRSMVPKAGLEPARLSPHAPQTCVSAIPPLRQPIPSNQSFRVSSQKMLGSNFPEFETHNQKLETRNSAKNGAAL